MSAEFTEADAHAEMQRLIAAMTAPKAPPPPAVPATPTVEDLQSRLELATKRRAEAWSKDAESSEAKAAYREETAARKALEATRPKPVATVPAPPATPLVPVPALPSMATDSKNRYEADIDTVRRILETEGLLSFDDFRGKPMLQRGVVPMPMSDKDYIDLRTMFQREKSFAAVGKELMRDAVLAESQRRRYDSAIEWLDSLKWDGVPRVDRFMVTHFGAEDSDYTRACGRYVWTGLPARIFAPGSQIDMVVALQSKQGTGKSTGLKCLVPNPDWFTDGLSLHKDDDNFKRLLRGKVVVEIAEMAGLSRADINVVKRCITRTTEKWVEKYQSEETAYERRCMLFASTNEREFLPPDETGQRRWLPVEIVEINRDLITADRDQLWAEGAVIYRASGIAYAEAERLAAGRHAKYEQHDVWEATISEWLETPPAPDPKDRTVGPKPCERPLRMSEILRGAIGLNAAHQDKKAEMRAAKVMRQLGYENQQNRTGKIKGRWWVRTTPPAPPDA